MNIALIGPSGAGKGTHASKLVTQFNLFHLCTGDLFRENLEQQTALGIIARRYMNHGEMVPDEVVDAMIEERVRRTLPTQRILFDGFPRTVYQAKFLDELFRQLGRSLAKVIYLDVSDEEIFHRIAGREICHECRASFSRAGEAFECPRGQCQGEHLYRRPDDTYHGAKARLKAFHRVTGPLLEYYRQTSRVAIILGEQEVSSVREALGQMLRRVEQNKLRPSSPEEVKALVARMSRPLPQVRPPVALDLLLIGAPGSGKGTQAVTLAKEMEVPHIATGDIFRENLRKQTELGKLAKTYMDRGELVPDDVTDAMVQQRLAGEDTRDGFILDGFPRNLHQAEALAEILAEQHRHVAGAILLQVPDEEIVKRLSGRWVCRKCQAPYHLEFKPPASEGICDACGGPLYQRDDDKVATVRTRLKTFHAQTEPVIRFYRSCGLLSEVDGTGLVEDVTERVLAAANAIEQRISTALPEKPAGPVLAPVG